MLQKRTRPQLDEANYDKADLVEVTQADLYKMRKIKHDQFEETWELCQAHSKRLKAIDKEIIIRENESAKKSKSKVLEQLRTKLDDLETPTIVPKVEMKTSTVCASKEKIQTTISFVKKGETCSPTFVKEKPALARKSIKQFSLPSKFTDSILKFIFSPEQQSKVEGMP